MTARVDHAVTTGTFSLDGETFDVDNNVWLVGDDTECVVIDAPHDVDGILAVVGDRPVMAILLHPRPRRPRPVAPALGERATGAPILLHPDDRPLWELTHPDRAWDADSPTGRRSTVARHHAAGAAHARARPGRGLPPRPRPRLRVHRRHPVPRRPGRDRPVVQRLRPIMRSIRARLLALPAETVVHTGHGDDTTIGAERGALG